MTSVAHNYTPLEKLRLLKAVAGSVYIEERDDRWCVEFRHAKFKTTLVPQQRSGDTLEQAILETWFWITGETEEPRCLGPAEPNNIIRRWGDYDVWWQWGGLTWEPVVIQPDHGMILIPGNECDSLKREATERQRV